MAITTTHTFEFVADTQAEYVTLLSQVATYIASGLNTNETVVSQVDQEELGKITLIIRSIQGTL